jgi:HSP20 family protein
MTETLVRSNGGVAQHRSSLYFTPRFDIWENDNEYVLAGDLPGVQPQDLDLKFENQELTIHGKVGARTADARYFAEEYGVGDFHRTFTVGELINGESISAELKDGVLVVHLPKRPEVRPRKIEVKVG